VTQNYQDNTRSEAIKLVAKANKLDLEIVQTETGANAPADYLKYNKLGLIPTFVGADGYVLSEAIAIAIYGKYFSVYLKSLIL
jgi:elongation factor 1-gamma